MFTMCKEKFYIWRKITFANNKKYVQKKLIFLPAMLLHILFQLVYLIPDYRSSLPIWWWIGGDCPP